jgi:hypothetical protein
VLGTRRLNPSRHRAGHHLLTSDDRRQPPLGLRNLVRLSAVRAAASLPSRDRDSSRVKSAPRADEDSAARDFCLTRDALLCSVVPIATDATG